MAFHIRCPHCGESHLSANSPQGKRLRCQECREVFVADDVREEGPRERVAPAPRRPAGRRYEDEGERRPRRRYRDDDDRPRDNTGSTVLLTVLGVIGGGILVVVLSCAGMGYWAVSNATVGPPPVPPAVAVQIDPAQPGVPGVPANPAPNNPPAPVWAVRADAGPRQPARAADAPTHLDIQADLRHFVVAPSTPSPFLSVGWSGSKFKQEFFNLATMQKIGEMRGHPRPYPGKLSPDGTCLLGQLQATSHWVVLACKDGSVVCDLGTTGPAQFNDFAGPNSVVIGVSEPNRLVYNVFDVPGGRKLREVSTPDPIDFNRKPRVQAVSAGGRYLAYLGGEDVQIYDLRQGGHAGTFRVPNVPPMVTHRELAFSADGQFLAVLMESGLRARIVTWKLEDNRLEADFPLSGTLTSRLRTGEGYSGRHLEWTADGSGWLLKGELLVDRRTSAPRGRLMIKSDPNYARHLVGNTHVAQLVGSFGKDGLEVTEILRAPGDFSKPPVPVVQAPPGPPAAKPVAWRVQPDPLPAGLTLPEKPEGVLPITGYPPAPRTVVDQVVFPSSPSPFVSVAVKGRIRDAHEVWDLRSMKRVGVAVEPEYAYASAFLSPDGKWFAVPSFMLKQPPGADVYSVADGQRYVVTVDKAYGSCDNIDFAGPGQVLTLRTSMINNQSSVLVQVFDIKTRSEVRRFEARTHLNPKRPSFSPGRRYLALQSRAYDRALLYDLTNGTLAGELPMPERFSCLGMCFSPDGKSFACLAQRGNESRLLRWDVATGKPTADHQFDDNGMSKSTIYQGLALEWLPNGKGWFVYGQTLVDASTGEITQRIPMGRSGSSPRRIFGDGQLAIVKGPVGGRSSRKAPAGQRSLVFEPLSADHTAPPPSTVAQGPKGDETPKVDTPPKVVRKPKGPRPPLKPAVPPEEAAVQKLGGYVLRDDAQPGKPVVGVQLYSNQVTDAGLDVLKAFPQLKKLSIGNAKITDAAFDRIKGLTQLQELSLGGCQDITDKGVAQLVALTKLQDLSLGGCKKITDDGFSFLEKMGKLQALDLSYTSITNAGAAHLAGLKGLRKLSLNATKVSDEALAHLEGMTEMRNLNLFNVGDFSTGKRITDKGMEHLKGMTKLEVLLIPNTNVTGKGMAHVKGMADLRELNVFCTHIGDAGLAELKGLGKLERLTLTGSRFTDDGLASIAGLTQLKDLSVGFSDLGDKGMAHLKGLTNLTSLDVSQSKVGDDGLAHLAKLDKLGNLNLRSTKVTDAGLKRLKDNKSLYMLWLSGPAITDEGMKALKDVPKLWTLYLSGTKVTDAGVQELKKALPRVIVSRN